jgi:hypothetical protein
MGERGEAGGGGAESCGWRRSPDEDPTGGFFRDGSPVAF